MNLHWLHKVISPQKPFLWSLATFVGDIESVKSFKPRLEVLETLVFGAEQIDEVIETSNKQILATRLGFSSIRIEVNVSRKKLGFGSRKDTLPQN